LVEPNPLDAPAGAAEMTEINEAEPVSDRACRPGQIEVTIKFMYWTQLKRFLDRLEGTSRARLDLRISETVGGFSVITIRTSHDLGLKAILAAYGDCDFVGPDDVVMRGGY